MLTRLCDCIEGYICTWTIANDWKHGEAIKGESGKGYTGLLGHAVTCGYVFFRCGLDMALSGG